MCTLAIYGAPSSSHTIRPDSACTDSLPFPFHPPFNCICSRCYPTVCNCNCSSPYASACRDGKVSRGGFSVGYLAIAIDQSAGILGCNRLSSQCTVHSAYAQCAIEWQQGSKGRERMGKVLSHMTTHRQGDSKRERGREAGREGGRR